MHRSRSTVLAISFLTFCIAAAATAGPATVRCDATASPGDSSTDAHALRSTVEGSVDVRAAVHADGRIDEALREMLLGANAAPLRWDRVPDLVVLMTVMQYENDRGTQYRATAQPLSDEEATQLVADLTLGLVQLTDGAFRGFAAVHRETVRPGEIVNVMRPGQIVVARYDGVRDQLSTIGFGGRSTRGSTIRAGSIILDSEFDRTSATRWLLRAHELGHALGYNHVVSRTSIMNPRIGSELTDVDRSVARMAFHSVQAAPSTCS